MKETTVPRALPALVACVFVALSSVACDKLKPPSSPKMEGAPPAQQAPEPKAQEGASAPR